MFHFKEEKKRYLKVNTVLLDVIKSISIKTVTNYTYLVKVFIMFRLRKNSVLNALALSLLLYDSTLHNCNFG